MDKFHTFYHKRPSDNNDDDNHNDNGENHMDTGSCIMYGLGLGLFGPGPQPFSQFLSVPLLPRRAHGPRLKMVGDRTSNADVMYFDAAFLSMILNVDSALFHQQKCSKKSLL